MSTYMDMLYGHVHITKSSECSWTPWSISTPHHLPFQCPGFTLLTLYHPFHLSSFIAYSISVKMLAVSPILSIFLGQGGGSSFLAGHVMNSLLTSYRAIERYLWMPQISHYSLLPSYLYIYISLRELTNFSLMVFCPAIYGGLIESWPWI